MTEYIEAVGSVAPGVVATAYGVRLFGRVVGPSIDQFAGVLGQFVGQRTKNFLGIAKAAADVIGDDPPPGAVHARVVNQIVSDATWLDDPVMQAYAGGLLAAARTPDGDDDRAAYYIRMLTGMTANQIAVHRAVYEAVAAHPRPADVVIGDVDLDNRIAVKVSLEDAQAVLVNRPANETAEDMLSEVAGALHRDALIGNYAVGGEQFLARAGMAVSTPSMVAAPSHLGALLYLWGHGVPGSNGDQLGRAVIRPLGLEPRGFRSAEIGPWFGA